jgi:hypothetical protein
MAFDPLTAGFDLIKTGLDKFFPDADAELKGKLDAAAASLSADLQQQLAQLEINKVEAAHSSIFIAGWRPFIGWVGGLGLSYQVLLMPIGNGIAAAFGLPLIFTGIDIALLQTTLGTMLGLGVARSWDKKNGAETKQIGKRKGK